jgi:hypothetical protein
LKRRERRAPLTQKGVLTASKPDESIVERLLSATLWALDKARKRQNPAGT